MHDTPARFLSNPHCGPCNIISVKKAFVFAQKFSFSNFFYFFYKWREPVITFQNTKDLQSQLQSITVNYSHNLQSITVTEQNTKNAEKSSEYEYLLFLT